MVLAGEAPASVLGTSYAEQLAEDLQQGGQQITLVQPRQRHCLPAPDREGLERVELEPSPLPTPASAGNRLLREAAALQARLERVVREQGPFDRVLAEGPLGALVGSALAKQHQLPFVLALERCEVARRGNRLTREQLHAAELEHWGAARAAEVWAPREATVAAIRRHYQPARVELRAPSRRGLRVPADPTRLLPALGLWRLPRLVLLTRPLAEEERERLFRSPAPPPPGVLLLDQAVWLTDDDGQLRCLSSRPARGPALATLLAAADALATDDACDRRVLEAQALGRQVAVWDPAPETTVQDLLARTESELLHV